MNRDIMEDVKYNNMLNIKKKKLVARVSLKSLNRSATTLIIPITVIL